MRMEGLPDLIGDGLARLRAIQKIESGCAETVFAHATQKQLDEWLRKVRLSGQGDAEDHCIAVRRIAESHGLASSFRMDKTGKILPIASNF